MTQHVRHGSAGLPTALRGGPKSPRIDRINKQLREEISQLMVREMKDPRVHLASVSSVSVSPDLRNARVMVSAIGEDGDRSAVVSALRHAQGYLRSALGQRLENLKNVPRLRFELDESIAYSVRVSAMLRELAVEQAGRPVPVEPVDEDSHVEATGEH